MRCIQSRWVVSGGGTALRWIALILPFMLAENGAAQAQVIANLATQSPALTTAQRERLKERDRLGEQAAKLRSEGKLAEAIAAAEGMLAIEREVLGDASDDAIGSLELIASIQEQRDDWPAAFSLRRNVLNCELRTLGEDPLEADRCAVGPARPRTPVRHVPRAKAKVGRGGSAKEGVRRPLSGG